MSGKLEQRIQSAHLTRTEKVIADYFLEHSGSLYFLTAKDLGHPPVPHTGLPRLP